MGRDKCDLIRPDGQTYLQHAVQRAKAVCRSVCIASGRKQIDDALRTSLELTELDVVADLMSDAGPVAGLVATLHEASRRDLVGCLVTPIDMPNLEADHLRTLIRTWQSDPERVACGVSFQGDQQRLEPLVAIYPTLFLTPLTNTMKSDHRSLSRWIETQDRALIELPISACRNINRPEDLNP